MPSEGVEFIDMKPELGSFKDEVFKGLSSEPKAISPKFFYDEEGSELFVKITETPEYYVTRSEEEILQSHSSEISEAIGAGKYVIEYGSGNSAKTEMLIHSLNSPAAYAMIDISADAVRQSAISLSRRFPALKVISICADYLNMNDLPESVSGSGKVIVFLGSTIGNFEPGGATEFLTSCFKELSAGDGILVGADLKKDVEVLNRAYNDMEGYTAMFNLNLLWRIKRELNAEVHPEKFAHKAFYNETEGRIEMHLVSLEDQEIVLDRKRFSIREGETIHTENSYKYTVEQFKALAESSGFSVNTVWKDSKEYFALFHLVK